MSTYFFLRLASILIRDLRLRVSKIKVVTCAPEVMLDFAYFSSTFPNDNFYDIKFHTNQTLISCKTTLFMARHYFPVTCILLIILPHFLMVKHLHKNDVNIGKVKIRPDSVSFLPLFLVCIHLRICEYYGKVLQSTECSHSKVFVSFSSI